MLPLLLVHGVPESQAVWDPLRAELRALGRTSVVLSPPSFGAPRSPTHPATADGYAAWLAGELERHLASSGAPALLVGHDWGGVHVLRTVGSRPDLVSGWVSDAAGMFHPDYAWHALAQTWQSAGAGEQAIRDLLALDVAARSHMLEERGLPAIVSRPVAAAIDATMGRSILTLYRSATQPALRGWGAGLALAAIPPGLVVSPEHDMVTGTFAMRHEMAAVLGAGVADLPGLGHWWLAEEPRLAAGLIHDFFERHTSS